MIRLATQWRKVWPRRLRHRALLLLVAVMLPTMMALVHLSVQRQEAMAMDSARQWVGALARAAASASAQSLATQDLAGLEAMLREIATTPGVQRIDVVDAHAVPLVTLLVDEQRRVRPLWRASSAQETPNRGALQAWAPVGRGGALGSIGVVVTMDAEQARLDRLRADALVGMAVMGAIIIAAFYALLQRALAPLSRLVRFARALPREPGARLEVTHGAWELAELGRALNEASGLLRRQFDELHASEQRTQAIVNAVPDAIIGTDAAGCISIASPAVQSVFGLAPGDLIGRPLGDLLPGLDATDAERRTLEQGLYIRSSGQHVARFETLAKRHGGTAFPVAVSLSRAETDGVVRYACMVRDLTEQHMAEEMLHLYSQALECTSNGVVISDLSMPGEPVFYANPAFYRITGYDPGEAIGRNCAFLQRGDTAQPQIDELRQAVRERRPASVVLRNYRKDGTLFFNELSIAPVNTAGGEVRHYVGVLNDVTERERARLAIAERSARLNAVFDLSPDGFVVFDREGQLVYTNRAFLGMTGWDDGLALQGLTLAEFDHRLGRLADPANRYPEMSKAGGAESFETMDLLQLSLPRPRVLTRLVRHNAGGQGESILYFRDVTRETEVDRLKSEFLTTAAHELRTPMVSVFGFTELLLNRPVTEGKRRDVLQTIHRQASLLINMVNELLDLARIEARQGKDLNREPQALGPLVQAVIGGLKGHDAARPVSVQLDHADTRVAVDADKFQRALGNVLSNAFKYSPGGGTVTLRTLAGDIDGVPATGIQVSDQGIGMSPAQVERVFERFYRADPSGHIPGTGLGMSLVKEIMDLHGGRAEVRSAPGQGTTVTLWFPQAPAHPTHIVAAPAA